MADGALPEFADRIGELLPEVIRMFVRREACLLGQSAITMPQFMVMNYLLGEREATMTVLARFLNVTTAAATGIVERLVKGGYVKRNYDVSDRRLVRVALTAAGEAQLRKIQLYKRRYIIDVFSKLSVQEREQYLHILSRVRTILQQEKNTEEQ